ncbi:hypothetical protein BBP40_008877 [Aspergillus hancockii]|nr:hypothetical protein BBP40_008877 [Aspergillus hancockii]
MGSFHLPAGDYEFPFEIPLSGNMIETISGPNHDYHSYQVHGVVQRRLNKNIIVSQPLRLYKPFTMEQSDAWMSSSIEGQCDNVVEYCISIPDVNIPFGSSFPVKFRLAPLSKDVKLGAITTKVIERHELRIRASASYSAQFNVHFLSSKRDHTVFSERYEPDEYVSSEPDIEWCTSSMVRLPQDLASCTQQINSDTMKIYHLLALTVELKRGNGITTMIEATIPFNVFMSPRIMGPDGTVHSLQPEQFHDDYDFPPPLYDDHKTDLLLSEAERPPFGERRTERQAAIPMGSTLDEAFFDCGGHECAPSYETAIGTQSIQT